MTIDWNLETDIVVIGGGGCGMAAALAAKQKELDVILIEKDRKLGGNTSLSTGSVPGAGTKYQEAAGIEDSPLRMATDIFNKANREGDWDLLLHLCEESKHLVEWLIEDMKINIQLVTDYKHVGHSQFRLHAPRSRRGQDLVNDLTKALMRLDVITATNLEGINLVTDDNGAVIGVETKVNQSVEYVKAKKVILATNGFGANKEMVRKYCPDIANASYFGAMGSTGEGILWGEKLGGELQAMGAYQGYAAVSTHGSLVSWTSIEKGGFLINKLGRRFANESRGYSALASDVQEQEEAVVYVIMDEHIKEFVKANEDEFKELVEIGALKGGTSTIEELAKVINVDSHTLRETFDNYHASVLNGNDPFGRTDFGFAPLQAPFYAVKASSGLFHTQGGLKINKYAQILRPNGTTIENLYAGGGVAVGVSGEHNGRGYSSGNGLLTAMGWGKIAGNHAAMVLREG